MGRAIINVISTPSAHLAGATESAGHAALGRDAGELAGIGRLDVPIVSDLSSIATPESIILDFTAPASSLTNLRTAIYVGAGIVIGTTGFNDQERADLDRLAPQTRSVVSANMSAGIAVLHRLVEQAAAVLKDDFDIEIVEMHHRLKVDAPSGTALALARTAANATGRSVSDDLRYGRQGQVGKRSAQEIGVLALRGGDVVGDHTVMFAGPGERIELTHRAQSRDCLARGAVRAALWLADKAKGRYGIEDVLGLR
jgi:4-hydroxy-tetrahydrodipicolinate reductase